MGRDKQERAELQRLRTGASRPPPGFRSKYAAKLAARPQAPPANAPPIAAPPPAVPRKLFLNGKTWYRGSVKSFNRFGGLSAVVVVVDRVFTVTDPKIRVAQLTESLAPGVHVEVRLRPSVADQSPEVQSIRLAPEQQQQLPKPAP